MTYCTVEPIKEKHIEDAAKLFAENYRAERKSTPLLPSKYGNCETIMPWLGDQAKKTPGVVALANKKLTGYLIGKLIPSWRGRRSAFVPFWAHAVTGKKRKRIFRQMYTQLSSDWTANGCYAHLISVLANDKTLIETLFWFGFGMAVIDSLRDLSDVQSKHADIEIRRGNLDDIETILSLSQEFRRYMAGSPIFMALTEKSSKKYNEEWLAKPSNAIWLGSYKNDILAYMEIGSVNENFVISDEKTAWIQGAYTKEHLRSQGVGAALLKQALNWAKSKGYEKCAVDFEGENILGSMFWLKYFKPICFSLVRHIDQRIGWAHKDRNIEHFW